MSIYAEKIWYTQFSRKRFNRGVISGYFLKYARLQAGCVINNKYVFLLVSSFFFYS